MLKVQILAGRTRSAAREKMMTSSPDHGAGDELQRLKAELAAALEDRDQKEKQLAELVEEVGATQAELARVSSEAEDQIGELQKELDTERMRTELIKLRAVEDLRYEQQSVLERERKYVNEERRRMEAWVVDLRESFAMERSHLTARITELEKEKQRRSRPEDGPLTPSRRHTMSDTEVSGTGAGGDHDTPDITVSGVSAKGVVAAVGVGVTVAEPLATVSSSSLSSPITHGDEHPMSDTVVSTTGGSSEHSTTVPATSAAGLLLVLLGLLLVLLGLLLVLLGLRLAGNCPTLRVVCPHPLGVLKWLR